MIFEVLIALIILLILYRKKFLKLAEIKFNYPLLFFLSFFLQFIVVYFGGKGSSFMINYGSIIYIISFLLLIWVLSKNLHLRGIKLIFIGIMLNFLAITLNNGTMPVSGQALEKAKLNDYKDILQDGKYPTHTLMQENTPQLSLVLGDFIPITPPHPRPRVISIGDIIMTAGVIYLLYYYIKY
ncbi:MAG: DUF5317 domain-containing protein [Halanaerobiales bacterium]